MSSSLQRRVGKSRNQPASPLLKSLPRTGASRESPIFRTATTPTAAAKKSPATAKMAPKIKVPVSFDAPPLSTDDENESADGEASEVADKKSPDPILDSSEDERPPRGDIKATNFQSSSKINGRRGRQFRLQERTGANRQEKKSSTESQASRSRKKRRISNDANEEHPSSPALGQTDHFKDRHGFTKPASIKMKYRAREKQKALVEDDIDDDQNEKSDDENDQGNSNRYGPKDKMNLNSIPLHCSPNRAAKFVHPGDSFGSSPEKKTKRLKMDHFEAVDPGDEKEPTTTKGRALKRSASTKRTPKGKPSSSVFIPRKRGAAAASKKAAEQEPKRSPSVPSSPAKKLVIPTPFSQFEAPKTNLSFRGDGDDSDSLSDVPSDISTLSLQDLLDLEMMTANTKTTSAATTTPCPWCGASVEKSFLQEFAKGKRLNVRMQSKFCHSHKKTTALETWKERKYPDVRWDELEDRFSEHRELLLGIINGGDSHYKSILATRIELGQVRSMKKEENLNPGYYGPRGFNLMCDYLVGEFGDLLKEKAVTDKVIAGRGSAAFIQSVLVAELAVQLIRKDMGVSASAAREIMEESKALGEMIHEDV